LWVSPRLLINGGERSRPIPPPDAPRPAVISRIVSAKFQPANKS
jgi:hypothetical protein